MYDHYKKTGHLFIPFGDDFSYTHAKWYFQSVDKLIKYFNN